MEFYCAKNNSRLLAMFMVFQLILLGVYSLAIFEIFDEGGVAGAIFMGGLVMLCWTEERSIRRLNNDYLVFEEEGIRVIDYGKTKNLFLKWENFKHIYIWRDCTENGVYLIIAEKPIPLKKRNRMANFSKRNIEDGIMIELRNSAYGGERTSIVEFVKKKLPEVEVIEKKMWYEHHYDRNMKRID